MVDIRPSIGSAGIYKGRKPSLTPEMVAALQNRVGDGKKKAALTGEFGISRETLYSYLRGWVGIESA
jgi:hypothetical protein